MEEFEQDINLDIHNLGEEVIRQASRYYKWSTAWVNSMSERDRIKNLLETKRYEVEIEIRENTPSKLTEATVKALTEINKEVMELKDKLVEITLKTNQLQTAKIALEQKKDMLDNAVRIYQTGYWGEMAVPNTNKITEKETDKMIKETLNSNERLLKRRQKNDK